MQLDWRQETDYAFTALLQASGWAWQFIRRSERYRAAWREKLDAEAVLTENPGDPAGAKRLHEVVSAAWEFGLVGLIDPDQPHTFILWIPPIVRAHTAAATIDQTGGPWPGYPDSIAVTFTFHQPLAPQIEQAARLLEDCERRVRKDTGIRAKEIRPDRKRFTLYLRLLDARQAGASLGEMGRVLFKDKADPRRSVKGALKAADAMAEGGFRDLLLTAL